MITVRSEEGSASGMGYVLLIAVFVTSLTSANFLAAKIAYLGSVLGVALLVPAGVVPYAVTFTATDIISEIYGRHYSERVVRAGFITQLLILFYAWTAIAFPQAPFMGEAGKVFNTLIASPPNVVVASLTAYLVSQHHDVWAFHYWRSKTGGRWLWLRNNASTLVSQAIDTTIFITLAFGVLPPYLGGTSVPWRMIPNTILGQYLIKALIALLDTPFVYLSVYILRKGWEG
jgi:uncharacterized integral membrane protein (TIGR00697 family)